MLSESLEARSTDKLGEHHANLVKNLKNRVAKAQTRHDQQLLALLAYEQEQLENQENQKNQDKYSSHCDQQQAIWTQLKQALTKRSQLSVERVVDAKGNVWWYVQDPRSGKTFNAESLNVAMHWIEENHLGQ
jgi:hypothetical protein